MTESKSFVFHFGDVEVREREFSLTKAGEVLAIEPKAFRVLLLLLHNPQKLITKEELLDAVWADAAVTESSLTRSIAKLRKTLGDDFQEPRYIETVAKVGYRWLCSVEVSEDGRHVGEPPDISAETDEVVEARSRSLRRWWWLASASVLVTGFVISIGVLRRPPPAPRISKFEQITHDGHEKELVGTDGSRLYMAVPGSPLPIAQVGIASGVITHIPVPLLNVSLVDVSPDGADLLVLSEASHDEFPLWNFRIPGGPLRQLSDDAVDAAFSVDGKSVVYLTAAGDIYLARSDGAGARKLASVGRDAENFSWSIDGHIIRFDRDNEFWQISSDGLNLHQVIFGWHDLGGTCCGRWTSDGRFFLFLARDPSTRGNQIWALDERHGFLRRAPAEPIQLTAGPVSWSSPVPGQDGKTVFSTGATFRGELSRFEAQAKEFRPFLGGISAQGITFSKDGKSVAYVSFPEGILWKANRDGNNPMQLSEPPMNVFMPRWSPDGTLILFSDISSDSKIYVVSAQGGNPRKLLPEGSGKQSDPDWSPDGRKVVFGTSFGANDPKGMIRIFDLDSLKIATVPGSVGMTDPRWSPDGRFIAASSFDGYTEYIFEVEAQRWTALPVKTGLTFPEWSRNSQFIYFLANWEEKSGLFRIRARGGQIEKVVDLKNWQTTGWFGGQWAGLDPTDAPLLLRDIGSSNVYALTLDH